MLTADKIWTQLLSSYSAAQKSFDAASDVLHAHLAMNTSPTSNEFLAEDRARAQLIAAQARLLRRLAEELSRNPSPACTAEPHLVLDRRTEPRFEHRLTNAERAAGTTDGCLQPSPLMLSADGRHRQAGEQ
jgi:hypothetical protein